MSAVHHSLLNTTYSYLGPLAHSPHLKMVSLLVVATLTALMFSLSAWANVQVAALYGTKAIVHHATYTTLLPLAITVTVVRIVTLLTSLRPLPLAAAAETIPITPPDPLPLAAANTLTIVPPTQQPLVAPLAPSSKAPILIAPLPSITITAPFQAKVVKLAPPGASVKKGGSSESLKP